MLGYCQKDKCEPHWRSFRIADISDGDLSVGCDLLLQYGQGNLKNKAIISEATVLEHCSTFTKLKM